MLERAVGLLTQALASPDASDQGREWTSEAQWELARHLRLKGKSAPAAQCDQAREALWQKQPPAKLVNLALRQAGRAVMIGAGRTPVGPRALAVRDQDLTQAAANLRQAIDLGFHDLGMLKNSAEAWMLLERKDVQPLLKQLESRGRADAGGSGQK